MTLESYLQQFPAMLVEDLSCAAVIGGREFFVTVREVTMGWEALVSVVGQDLTRETVISFEGGVWKQMTASDPLTPWEFDAILGLDEDWTVVVL